MRRSRRVTPRCMPYDTPGFRGQPRSRNLSQRLLGKWGLPSPGSHFLLGKRRTQLPNFKCLALVSGCTPRRFDLLNEVCDWKKQSQLSSEFHPQAVDLVRQGRVHFWKRRPDSTLGRYCPPSARTVPPNNTKVLPVPTSNCTGQSALAQLISWLQWITGPLTVRPRSTGDRCVRV
jgi:hypothetical protein